MQSYCQISTVTLQESVTAHVKPIDQTTSRCCPLFLLTRQAAGCVNPSPVSMSSPHARSHIDTPAEPPDIPAKDLLSDLSPAQCLESHYRGSGIGGDYGVICKGTFIDSYITPLVR